MKFQEIAARLGVTEYPEVLNGVYENLANERVDICDLALIEKLQKEFEVFGEYYDKVVEGATAVAADPVRKAWGETVATALKTKTVAKARLVPTPVSDETVGADMLPLLILIPFILDVEALYRKMGFEESEVLRIVKSFGGCIKATEARTGRPGYNRSYFNWQGLYLRGALFRFQSFNYELRDHDFAYILKNRTTGELLPVMADGTYHRSGMVLGSAGYEDEEGSFEATFEETEDSYIGYPAIDNLVVNRKETYPRSEWECVLRPGDHVISVHIPAKTDLSPEAVEKSYLDGLKFIDEQFPDYKPKAYFCKSWLLDPHLEEMLGSQSKISRFLNGFTKWPGKSEGRDVFGFVFVGFKGELKDLPEDTTLMRKLKAWYLEGNYIHGTCGVLFR